MLKPIFRWSTGALVALSVMGGPIDASANVFGQCAHLRDSARKIAACTEATRSTPYERILHWVYRELARAHRQRGDTGEAIWAYSQSLASKWDDDVSREMNELLQIDMTQPRAQFGN